jgi:hypothetical protein
MVIYLGKVDITATLSAMQSEQV